jgi:NADPH:quinone reductase-like Zn-dependent oxidoreductase
MKAMVQDSYGPPSVLELREVDQPAIGDGEVLVRVRAAGVDPGVWHLTTGRPYLVRLFGFGVRRPKVRVRGRDLAGVVEAVGPAVTRFQVGDEVYGTCDGGSYAEFAAAPQDRLARKPAKLSFEQAAVTPISAMTALQAVAGVRAGQQVMVIGAAGGVGSFATQLAVAEGATVTAVCGAAKADLARSLGAAEVVDYGRTEVDQTGRRYDRIIDTAGNRPLSLLRRALTPDGTLILVGGEQGGGPLLAGFDRQFRAPLLSLFVRQNLRGLTARESVAHLDRVTELIESGALTPALTRARPLAEVPAALDELAAGHATGKTAITL